MFTFLHAADIHLDSPLRGLSRYESAPVEAIRNGCRKAFENLVDLAIAEKVAFVLLAGDLYDGDWKDYSTGIFLGKQMGRLDRHGIAVFVVAGNHDAANRMTKALDSPANMHMLSSRKVQTIHLNELDVAIHGQSFASQHVDENLAVGFPVAEKDMFNIGLLHTSLDGREGHASYAPCSLGDLHSKGYQYWALGHVHKREFVSKDPWVVFPGCVQGRHVRETGAKGCVLVTVEDGSVKDVKEHALDVLRWSLCQVDLTDVMTMRELRDRTRKMIEKQRLLAGDLPLAMRIRFEGTTALADKLVAYPQRFEEEMRALAAEIAGDELWLERVENTLVARRDMDTVIAGDGAFAQLLKEVLAVPDDPDEIRGLDTLLANLRKKIPHELIGFGSTVDLEDKNTLERLVREAKHMLLGRLLVAEDDE